MLEIVDLDVMELGRISLEFWLTFAACGALIGAKVRDEWMIVEVFTLLVVSCLASLKSSSAIKANIY